MAIATSNRLLPILAGVVVLMLAFVTIKSCSNEPDDRVIMEAVPQAPLPDADTPADTIKTLTANVAAMTAEVKALRQDNGKLRNENRQLLNNRVQIEDNVTTRVKRELLSREHDQEVRQRMDSSVLSSLTARVVPCRNRYHKGNRPRAPEISRSAWDSIVAARMHNLSLDWSGSIRWMPSMLMRVLRTGTVYCIRFASPPVGR